VPRIFNALILLALLVLVVWPARANIFLDNKLIALSKEDLRPLFYRTSTQSYLQAHRFFAQEGYWPVLRSRAGESIDFLVFYADPANKDSVRAFEIVQKESKITFSGGKIELRIPLAIYTLWGVDRGNTATFILRWQNRVLLKKVFRRYLYISIDEF